jgi:hypothetical protein
MSLVPIGRSQDVLPENKTARKIAMMIGEGVAIIYAQIGSCPSIEFFKC